MGVEEGREGEGSKLADRNNRPFVSHALNPNEWSSPSIFVVGFCIGLHYQLR